MKKSELRKMVKEELLKEAITTKHFAKVDGVEINFTGIDDASRPWDFVGKSIVKFVKKETEIGPLRVKSINIEYH